MTDQAHTLRHLARQARHQDLVKKRRRQDKTTRSSGDVKVISITSGKGGVGKTNVVVNLAYMLQSMGSRVMVFDADLGLANIDVLLGLTPHFNIQHLIEGEKLLSDILVEGPKGMVILPAGSGKHDVLSLSEIQRRRLLRELETLDLDLDFLLIDTGAGISAHVMSFNAAAHDIIVVVTPEPTSLTDAYTLMKVLTKQYDETYFKIIVNNVANETEAKQAFRRLNKVTEQFLKISIEYLGFILHDMAFTQAVRQQQALVELYPESDSTGCFHELAQRVLDIPGHSHPQGNLSLFWKQLLERAS